MDLLKASHVASSIKLLILKTFDACTSSPVGMESLLGWNTVMQQIKTCKVNRNTSRSLLEICSKLLIKYIRKTPDISRLDFFLSIISLTYFD